jgi:uncharacterized protein YciI
LNSLAGALLIISGCATAQPLATSAPPASLETFVCFLHPTQDGFIEAPTEEEQASVGEHFQRLKMLTEQGVVLLAGPSTDPPYTGIVILQAENRAEAGELMNADPAVLAGVFRARVSPMRLALVGELPRAHR